MRCTPGTNLALEASRKEPAGEIRMGDLFEILPQERKLHNDFCRQLYGRELQSTPPDKPLWYYTSAETFIKIIDTGTIWATQISCLNDHTEFRYAVNLVGEALQPSLSPA